MNNFPKRGKSEVRHWIQCQGSINRLLLTVKAATLIFISGRGLAILSAKQGKSGFIYKISFLSRANMRALIENLNPLYSELTFINS